MKRLRQIALVAGIIAVGAGLVGAGYLLASNKDDAPAAPQAAAPTSGTATNGAGGAELRALLEHGRSETYHARYKASSTDPGAAGQDLTLELWQRGSDRRQDLLLNADGKKAHSAGFLLPSGAVSCTMQADTPWSCKNVSGSASSEPMLDQMAGQFAGQAGLGRDDSIVGFKVRCFAVPVGTGTGEICLTERGVPARVMAGPSRFELTELDTTVQDETFRPPAQPV
jgi:hypothetical protein